MMDQILECSKGVIGIADDVVIYGCDDKEHDQCLHTLMQVTREHGLVFNGEKCAIKQPSIKFFASIYDKDGTHPYPSKLTAIHNMLAPETPSQLQKFLGMVTYLSPFVLSLSSFTAPLHGLLKKDVEFTWNETYQDAFDSVKSLVCSDTTLCYFDICRPVMIQVDASKKGLGAVLLQDGCPVAFASKALTPTKQCYANIECDLLTCIFGAEQFCTYVFGCKFTIESNQKSLGQIMLKNLADAPACLQRMLLCLQNYDICIKYQPGREMLIVDALSCYSPLAAPAILLDISVNHLHITPQKKIDFQEAVHSDPTLCALAEMIIWGWPEDICDVPMDLCPYHHACDVLTVEDGLILHGESLVIPPPERDKVLQSIHEGHQGISKCQYHACQCIYWPGINWDIKCAIEACTTCQCHHTQEL